MQKQRVVTIKEKKAKSACVNMHGNVSG